MPRAIFIPVEGPIVQTAENPEFESLRQYVGGHVNCVVVPVTPEAADAIKLLVPCSTNMVFVCNEDGNALRAPSNPRASLLLWHYFGYALVGDIVLLDGFDIE